METAKQVAERIKGMREILEISVSEMARLCSMTEDEYLAAERGERELTFTFLNNCATRFEIDLAVLLTGGDARLQAYSIERKGEGLQVERREGFDYRHLASRFKNRKVEPYLVTVPYSLEAETGEIKTSSHDGQEMDYVLFGSLKISVNGKTEVLNEGDSIIYDSSKPHGMVATGGKPCKFLALLMK